jgi:hypothetical protein
MMEIDGLSEAQGLLAAFDAGELSPYVTERSARDLADFWLENRYAQADEPDDDSEEEAAYYAVLSGLETLLEEEE